MAHSKSQLAALVSAFQSELDACAWRYFEAKKLPWKSFQQHFDARPYPNPVVTVLPLTDYWGETLAGYYDVEGAIDAFYRIVDASVFFGERENHSTFVFTARHESLGQEFSRHLQFEWICSILRPEYASINQELFEQITKTPDLIQNLDWRQFEFLLDAIFRNHGYRTELGPGGNDGGVDIRLYQHDLIGEVVTLVQAKRYDIRHPIGLEAVAALHAIADAEQANRALFVTTSRYLPSAQRFAATKRKKLILTTSRDVIAWCEGIAERLKDFRLPETEEHILVSLSSQYEQPLIGQVVYANVGVTMIMVDFGVIVRQTPLAILIKRIGHTVVSDDGYGQSGLHVADRENVLNEKPVFAKRSRGRFSDQDHFWDGRRLWGTWDGKTLAFDYRD